MKCILWIILTKGVGAVTTISMESKASKVSFFVKVGTGAGGKGGGGILGAET